MTVGPSRAYIWNLLGAPQALPCSWARAGTAVGLLPGSGSECQLRRVYSQPCTQLGMRYLGSAWLLRSPEGLRFSRRPQVVQSSVLVGMKPQELGTACAYGPGRGWGWGCSGEKCGRCLGDQILSQEARGLARQSLGAQVEVPGGMEKVDETGGWVGHRRYPSPKPHPRGALKKKI